MPTVTNRGIDAPASRREIQKENAENFNPIINGRMLRNPLRKLYIHSVSPRTFVVRNPPLFSKLELRGKEEGKRYITCTSLPDPIIQVGADNERGGNRLDDNDAWAAAVDMLNPLCASHQNVDPYTGSGNPDFYANRLGMNYIVEGIFPSFNEVPTEEELKRAEDSRFKRLQWGVKEAKRLESVSRKDLDEFLQQNPWVHQAMREFRMKASWTSDIEMSTICANCGDDIKPGLAFHQSSAGILCIIDPERALKAGAINKERYKELTTV